MSLLDRFQFTINSDDGTRLSSYTDANGNTQLDTSQVSFNFSGRSDLRCGLDEYYTFVMSTATIPVTFYNVNSYNDTITISGHPTANVNGDYVLTHGNFTAYTLVTMLQNTATSGSGDLCYNSNAIAFVTNFTVTYDSIREILYFKCTTSNSSKPITISGNAVQLLGFKKSSSNVMVWSSVDTAWELYSTQLMNVSYTNTLFITSKELRTRGVDSTSASSGTDILATVQINQHSPSIMSYQSFFEQKLLSRDMTSFTIYFRDQDRNVMALNGIDWIITLDIRRYKNDDMIQNISDAFDHQIGFPTKKRVRAL